ncbi:MAG: hypothetical protein EAZ51_09620 [Sphingobacteriales bacterium]|nr:MAG: hypothetical protein EAZ64_01970 [Sphingobacteriales bacterium]TAF78389.1 MAG: hypothetical protein EAZ51_09620 [Sphingobacteriales bacterium]
MPKRAGLKTRFWGLFNGIIIFFMIDKPALLAFCQAFVSAKADSLKLDIKNTQEASNNDTKSSMGDKYETSREMLQQDINRLKQQLAETQKMLFSLQTIKFKPQTLFVDVATIVNTTLGIFFIAASIGAIHCKFN